MQDLAKDFKPTLKKNANPEEILAAKRRGNTKPAAQVSGRSNGSFVNTSGKHSRNASAKRERDSSTPKN